MSIPEAQLETWSHQGATVSSAQTYNSIQTAIASYSWTANIAAPTVYLQGSYRNHTNIRGDSDVDTIAETNEVFYSNLTALEQNQVGWRDGSFDWNDLNSLVLKALVSYYGSSNVTQGKKCISVSSDGGRLNADVVPCCEYRQYDRERRNHVKGITFWTQSGVQVINFPKLHHDNGAEKNASCNSSFKPLIRVFKNARNRANSDFPSYFLECLLYNVPDSNYRGSYGEKFLKILSSLVTAAADGSLEKWRCQNRQQKIFGNAIHQIQFETAVTFLNKLVDLWKQWV